jgi:integrase
VVNARIKPGLGALKLEGLTPHVIQIYCNDLSREGLAPKTVKNVHGILHKCLQQAVINGYIKNNPADSTVLPRINRRDIKPLDETQISTFLKTIQGHEYSDLFTVTLFTGMREGEALGLLWDCVDLESGTLKVDKQLQLIRGSRGQYQMVPTKNSKSRTITLAPSVVKILRNVRRKQLENKMLYGAAWENSGFVFTNELGHHLFASTVYKSFKRVMEEIGSPETRFHDLRHSYCTWLRDSGIDIHQAIIWMGHADEKMILRIYDHPGTERETAAKNLLKTALNMRNDMQPKNQSAQIVAP